MQQIQISEVKRSAVYALMLGDMLQNAYDQPGIPMIGYKRLDAPYGKYLINCQAEIIGPHGNVIRQYVNDCGYKIACLIKDNGRMTSCGLHHLLAMAFIPNPRALSDVDHINGNRLDNALSNLRWISHANNLRRKASYGRRAVNKIDKSGKVLAHYRSFSQAAKANGLSNTSVAGSCNGTLKLTKYQFVFA